MTNLEQVLESFSDEVFTKMDGFDEAIIGVDERSMRLIYSEKKCIEVLMEEGMSDEEAIQYFEFNVKGAYIGENTPIICSDNFLFN